MLGGNQATNGGDAGGHGGHREREKTMETTEGSARAEADAQAAYRKQLQIAKDRLMTLSHAIELLDLARQNGAPVLWNQVGDITHNLCEFLGTDAAGDPE
jgi:hypothetical protein